MANRTAPLRVFIFDLLSTVPYYAAALAAALARSGARVTFGLTTYWRDRGHFRARGLRPAPGLLDVTAHIPLGPDVLRRTLKSIEALVNIAALAVRWTIRPPDIVHVQFLALWLHGFPCELWLLGWARKRGARLVYTVHDVLPHDTGRSQFDRYARLYSRFDAVVCHSENIRARLLAEFALLPERIWVLPHGPLFSDRTEAVPRAAALHRLGYEPATPLLLWQGIIHPYKGVLFLLDGWAQVVARRPDARLLIAGSPAGTAAAHASEITRRIDELDLAASVRTDFRYLSEDELQTCYAAASAVVYPYREITTSGALMTGLGRGKALIATRLPSFLELLTDGGNALLVDYGDTGALAASILRLLEDPSLRIRLESAAEAAAARYGWDAIALRTLERYGSLKGAPR